MSITAMTMGDIIREKRKALDMTQNDLSQAVGVSIQAVSKWEIGQSFPDITLLPAIADCLQLSLSALFNRAEAACPAPTADTAFPDDGCLRVVQFLGSRRLGAQEVSHKNPIRLMIEEAASQSEAATLAVEIHGSAFIEGTIGGSANARGDFSCAGNVNGNATAGCDFSCAGNVNGSAAAGCDFSCAGTVNGDVAVGGDLRVSSNLKIHGNVTCGGDVCGDAIAKGSISCVGDINGNADAGGDITCEGDINGSVSARGSISCNGHIEDM